MIKNLQKHGNSLALVIEKPILDLLNIDQKTPLRIELSTHPLGLTIHPLVGLEDQQIEKHLAQGNRKFGKMLKRLAE